jgi:hypothetical protein
VIASYRASKDITLYPEFADADGNLVAIISATYSLHTAAGQIADGEPVDLYGYDRPQLVVGSELNNLVVDQTKNYRRVEIDGTDENGLSHIFEIIYFIQVGDALVIGNNPVSVAPNLVVGENSFSVLSNLLLIASQMIHLRAFHFADKNHQVSALTQAWNNLGQLPVRFEDLRGTDSFDKGSTRELIDVDILNLAPKTYQRLLRAQVIEADDVLGGNPIEARRRAGLISDSAGESAHFFRSSKPLSLPCCRAAIDELRGIVNWGARIGRG